MLSIRHATTTTITAGTTDGWASLLESEERHAARQGLGAGVMVVHYAGELLRHVDPDDRALTEAAVLAVIERHLGWTDRTAPIAPGRLGIVTVPIDGPLALTQRARALHRDLRACDLDIDVAYSIRRRTGGMAAAAARADAALDNALARRARTR